MSTPAETMPARTTRGGALLAHALDLHAAGINVFPCRTDGSKAPLTYWKQYQSVRVTEQQILEWFSDGQHGLGAFTGTISGGLELLEVEGRAADRVPELADLAQASGLGDLWARICSGWVEQSPGLGKHWFYRVDGPMPGNTKIASDATHQTLAETRGEGGFVILAPTDNAHTTGRPWVRLIGGPATIPTITGDERGLLHSIFATLDEQPEPAPVVAAVWTGAGQASRAGGTSPGDDYEARTDWADILQPHGWTLIHARGRERYWRRPGKSEGVSATTGSAADRERLYVFSTSTPFDAETPYTKFGAYAVLNHGSDHSAAARTLAGLGYGERPATPPPAAQQPSTGQPSAPPPAAGAPTPPTSEEAFTRDVANRARQLAIEDAARAQHAAARAGTITLPETPSLAERFSRPRSEQQWRIEGLMPANGNVLLAAQFKAGKSTMMANLIRAFVDGDAFLGQFPTTASTVALVDLESDPDRLDDTLLMQAMKQPDKVSHVATLRGKGRAFNILDDTVRSKWADRLRGVDILIVDPLRPILDALGLSEDKDGGKLVSAFDALKDEAGIKAGVLVHHMGHNGERARGDSALLGWPDVLWNIVRQTEDPASPRFFKAFGRGVDVAETALSFDPATQRYQLGEGNRKDAALTDIYPEIRTLLTATPGLPKSAIEKALEDAFPRLAVRKAIDTMVGRGEVRVEHGLNNAKRHYLTFPSGWQKQ